MISYSNFVTFYETVLECNQAIRQLQGVMEIDFKFSPVFDTYENLGWYYACLFTNDPKEMDTLEEQEQAVTQHKVFLVHEGAPKFHL